MQKVADIIFSTELKNKQKLLFQKKNKQWISYSGKDFYDYAFRIAGALVRQGITKGDNIALISENRPEWNFVDYGTQLVGAVTIPIFPTISETDLQFILANAQPKFLFVSNNNTYRKISTILANFTHIKVICFDEIENISTLQSFIADIKTSEVEPTINPLYKDITADDILTILYTSGTSGQPKGVVLTHKNLLSNVQNCQHIAPFTPTWEALSFLPLNHIYERMVNTLLLYNNVTIYYAEAIEKVVDNIKEIKPHLFVSVPRLLERVYQKIIHTKDEMKGFKKYILKWAIELAERYELNGNNGFVYGLKRKVADALVYKKWRAALGGRLVCVVSGGAALNPKIERMFLCAKINCLQGYGLTETSPVVAVNGFEEIDKHIGSVGKVIPNTIVKIAEDGEILVKGAGVMQGYYKNESATQESIDADGWFHTGDIGEFVNNEYLKITDRKKELFKTSAGKYISPAYIENKLKESPLIEQCIVVGSNEKFPSALIVPSLQNYQLKFPDSNIKTLKDIAANPELAKFILDFVQHTNKTLAPHEHIRNPQLLKELWSVEGGELTPKMSLKRHAITKKYKNIIDTIYRKESVES